MNKHYEELNNNIKLIHDVDTLEALKHYNYKMNNLFYESFMEDVKKPMFQCCVEFLNYTKQLEIVIDEQITNTLHDMEYCKPADED